MNSKSFTSPINLDDGDKHAFIGHAKSNMGLFIDNPARGFIVWEYTFIDGDHKDKTVVTHIDLYFNKKRLVGFDGVHELPDEAISLLEENGYDTDYARSI